MNFYVIIIGTITPILSELVRPVPELVAPGGVETAGIISPPLRVFNQRH